MAKTKKIEIDYTKPGHYMSDGEVSGYDLLPDGTYKIAPCSQQVIEDILDEIGALDAILKVFTDHLLDRRAHAEKRSFRWFEDTAKSLRRPADLRNMQYLNGGVVRFIDPKPEEPAK